MHHRLVSFILRAGIILAVALLGPLARVSAQEAIPTEPGQPLQLQYTGCTRINVAPVNAAYEQRVVDLVNQHRASLGVPPLRRSTDLDYAARYHAADMAADRYFDHDTYDGLGGTTFVCDTWTRLRQFYTGYDRAGENIAAGYATPEDVMQGWLASSGHRANIENPAYNEIGVGYYTGGPYGKYWVQDFGHRDLSTLGGLPGSITFLYGLDDRRLTPKAFALRPANTTSSQVLTWTVVKSGDINWLSLDRTGGSTPSTVLQAAPVNLSAYNTPGEHTGALTFTAISQNGLPVINSGQAVSVRLVIAETLTTFYLPGVTR